MFKIIVMKLMGKNYISIIWLFQFCNHSCFVLYTFFSPSLCMNFHSGANAGATSLTLARFFLTKVIFVFLYLNLCYLNDMLVYRLTIHQQKYFYFREDIQNETRLHGGEAT